MRAVTKIAVARATGRVERHVLDTGDPSDPDHALHLAGGLRPSPHATLAGPTFEQWLNTAAAVPR